MRLSFLCLSILFTASLHAVPCESKLNAADAVIAARLAEDQALETQMIDMSTQLVAQWRVYSALEGQAVVIAPDQFVFFDTAGATAGQLTERMYNGSGDSQTQSDAWVEDLNQCIELNPYQKQIVRTWTTGFQAIVLDSRITEGQLAGFMTSLGDQMMAWSSHYRPLESSEHTFAAGEFHKMQEWSQYLSDVAQIYFADLSNYQAQKMRDSVASLKQQLANSVPRP